MLPHHSAGSKVVLTGLIGRDILASRSRWLHEREATAHGIELRYELIDFSARGWDGAQLSETLAELQAGAYAGVNVTHPFKQAVLPFLDSLSDDAQQIGAVNTISFLGGKRRGYNTDMSGFAESLQLGLPQACLDRVVQLGAGGAGSATAYALLNSGVKKLDIFEENMARARALCDKLSASFTGQVAVVTDLRQALDRCDGIVNATPVGMVKYPGSPVPISLLRSHHWVADIVYFPLETELLSAAARVGCQILNGGGMAVGQAAAAFDIFTGIIADRARMARSFTEFAIPADDIVSVTV